MPSLGTQSACSSASPVRASAEIVQSNITNFFNSGICTFFLCASYLDTPDNLSGIRLP